MSTLSDFVAKQKEFNAAQSAAIDEINASVTGIAGDVDGLKKRIEELLADGGDDIPADLKAELEGILADSEAIANKAKAAAGTAKALDDATPPVAPVPPT